TGRHQVGRAAAGVGPVGGTGTGTDLRTTGRDRNPAGMPDLEPPVGPVMVVPVPGVRGHIVGYLPGNTRRPQPAPPSAGHGGPSKSRNQQCEWPSGRVATRSAAHVQT